MSDKAYTPVKLGDRNITKKRAVHASEFNKPVLVSLQLGNAETTREPKLKAP